MEQSNFKDKFQGHLDLFAKTIEGYPEISKVKNDLEELKTSAVNDNEMNLRQKDAIIARIENYIAGQYGEQVKKENNRSDYSKGLK